ncbi:hypothetical protein ElyMa_002296300 [Elysia marginata]|uniref:Uncharacterized protein n=1 Tax=Elysia marginata TaxID=1093978 RepID=A0AAV4G2M0_9GAST|nr:hypothetical protein ElyMa_002296300 [Elysia marginata]
MTAATTTSPKHHVSRHAELQVTPGRDTVPENNVQLKKFIDDGNDSRKTVRDRGSGRDGGMDEKKVKEGQKGVNKKEQKEF